MGSYGFENIDSSRSLSMQDLKRMRFFEGKGICNQKISWSKNSERTASVTATTTLQGAEGGFLQLGYTSRDRRSGEVHEMDYRVSLTSVPCRFGGRKWYYRCPNKGCQRRCRVLYSYREFFICRRCTGLWYDSQTYTVDRYRVLNNLFKAERLEQVNNRRYYRGKPTRWYRRYLKLTGCKEGMELMRYHCLLEQQS
ncbi:MAG: hypothetical protein KBC95_01035, partial [Candidatus Peribacteraceae bacterium]|nr:hypothetical protein [Candidatus Peribacteraceae bacterium]